MLNLQYVNEKTYYEINFKYISENIIQIIGNFPIKEKGFILSKIGDPQIMIGDYSEYITVYKEIEDGAMFSNNSSIFTPKINFYTGGGGSLDGEITQEVNTYEELIIPTCIPNENYEFVKWEPSILLSGKIDSNKTFTAIFASTLPEPDSEPTVEERLTAVEEQNVTLSMTVDSILTDVIPSLM